MNLVSTSFDYNVIWDQLDDLINHPTVVGLSQELRWIRSEISRIADGDVGPGTPVLVLGESGSGKASIAWALHLANWERKRSLRGNVSDESDIRTEEQNEKDEKKLYHEIPCGYFTEHMLQDQLFGHHRGAFTGADNEKVGLLVKYSAGTLTVNDIGAADLSVQAALLSVLDAPKGKPAEIRRLGGEDQPTEPTRVWLIFTTSANISSLVRENKMREDFLFRFEDRVISVPPLHKRRADLPAIAKHIWSGLWNPDDTRRRALAPPVLRWLAEQKTEWRGNVRALRTLLSLAASRAKLEQNKLRPAQSLMAEIMAKGPEYPDWLDILREPVISVFVLKSLSPLPTQPSVTAVGSTSQDTPSTQEIEEVRSHTGGERLSRIRRSAPEAGGRSKVDLNPTLLEKLNNASSPEWQWMTDQQDEEGILNLLREKYLADQGRALLDDLEQRLTSRKSREEGGEGDDPRRIHHYKLLLYLALQGVHAGHMVEFQNVLHLGFAQTSAVVDNLVNCGCITMPGKDGRAYRYVLVGSK